MAYRLEIQGNYLVITNTTTGRTYPHPAKSVTFDKRDNKFLLKNSSEANEKLIDDIQERFLEVSEYLDAGGAPYTESGLSAFLYASTGFVGSGGGGGGGTGTSNTTAANQVIANARLQSLIDEANALEILETEENSKLEDVKTALAAINTSDESSLTELQAIKTSLAAIDVDSDQLALLKTNLDTLITEGNETQVAILASQVAQVASTDAIKTSTDLTTAEVKKQGEDIVSAVQGITPTPTRTFGRDDFDGTIIYREQSADGATVEYKDATTGSAYTLQGAFVVDPTLGTQRGIDSLVRRAITDGVGYVTDDSVERIILSDLSTSPVTVLSTTFKNLTQGTELVTADVDETQLTNSPVPEDKKENRYFNVSNVSDVAKEGIVTQTIRKDGSFVWSDNNGFQTNAPVSADHRLVPLDFKGPLKSAYVSGDFPLVFPARSLKVLFMAVISGEYSIKEGALDAVNYTPSLGVKGVNDEAGVTDEDLIDYVITIDEVTPGQLLLSGADLKTSIANDPLSVLPTTVSTFIHDYTDVNLYTENAGLVEQVASPSPIVGSAVMNNTASAGIKTQNAEGIFGLTRNVNNNCHYNGDSSFYSNSHMIFAASIPFSATGANLFIGFNTPLRRVRKFFNDSEVLLYDQSSSATVTHVAMGLTPSEIAGDKAVIFDCQVITSGGNQQYIWFLYSQNNPNGLQLDDRTFPELTANTQQILFANAILHYDAYVPDGEQDEWVTFIKTKINF